MLFAGTETSSGILGRILHLLATHPEVQDQLRAELSNAREGTEDDFAYDTLMSLAYLDAICRETLRLCASMTYNVVLMLMESCVPATLVPV